MGGIGDTDIKLGGTLKELPITSEGTLKDWEDSIKDNDYETAVFVDSQGRPLRAFEGDAHSVAVDPDMLQNPMMRGGTMTHNHPDKDFGGTFSMADLNLFAKSVFGEMRAVTADGRTYIVRAEQGANRGKLSKWIARNNGRMQKNFNNAYKKMLKQASQKPIASGAHKGKIRITTYQNGKAVTKYVNPMTPRQADAYARQQATGMYQRAYQKALGKMGFSYTVAQSSRTGNRPNTVQDRTRQNRQK